MGLCNASAIFQRLMGSIFSLDEFDFDLPYLYDLIVFSKNESEHSKHLDRVFIALQNANISLYKRKMSVYQEFAFDIRKFGDRGNH